MIPEERWIEKRVGDLVEGDVVRGYGPVRCLEWVDADRFPEVVVWTDEPGTGPPGWGHSWPVDALVPVAVPMVARWQPVSYANDLAFDQWERAPFHEVRVGSGTYDDEGRDDEVEVALFRIRRHAEEYVDRLNADPALIGEAVAEARKQKPRAS